MREEIQDSQEREDSQKKQKKPMDLRRRIFYGLLAALIIVVVLIAGRLVNVMFIDPLSAFNTAPTPEAPAPPPATASEPAEVTPVPTPTLSPEEALRRQADMEFLKNKVNILMLGWDQSPEREDEGSALYRDEKNNYRSDVIMLLTVDFETKRVDLISIPRDTYAPIYNTAGRWKINAAFAHGGSAEGQGFEYAMNTVSDLLGVPIHYYAGVDMTGLKAVVDAMGGVDYDVDVRIVLNGRVLEKGMQHMDGQQVLDYCRARKGISTDVGRNDRQQRMLFTIFEQLQSRDQLVNFPKIYMSVQDKIKTNMNIEQIAALSVFAMNLDMENLHRHTLAGSYVTGVYNASFYVLKNDKLTELIQEVFGLDHDPDNRYDINYVQADKAASTATPYLAGGEYLLALRGPQAEGGDILRACLEELRGVAQRTEEEAVDPDGAPLDRVAIESAQHKVYSAMLNFCRLNSIGKNQVDATLVPEILYTSLALTYEEAPESYPQPSTTPRYAPTLTPTPRPGQHDTDPEGIE